jgi:chemotaxis protein methyltransferase CheR
MTVAAVTFEYVRDLVHRDSAIVLAPGKEYLVEARLTPLVRATGEASVDTLVQRLRITCDAGLRSDVVEALTTNETSWYRDGDPFLALRNVVLQELTSRAGFAGSLRIWSAACSSGQEAYTIAMELAAFAGTRPIRTEIIATDLSARMVERVRAGRYSQLEVNRGLPATSLVRHFTRKGPEWVIDPKLRAMVSARTMNLAAPFAALGVFDIVFLRNVLIYFDVPTKQAILRRVRGVMRPDSCLFLGSAEVTLGVDQGWERHSLGRSSFYRPTLGA